MGVASGFVAVPGSRRRAGVVARAVCGGRWVWARRALPAGPGWHPAPACLFVPFPSVGLAAGFARLVASGLGWRVWLRRGAAGSPVFAAVGLPVPAWSVKVALPAAVHCAAALAALWRVAW